VEDAFEEGQQRLRGVETQERREAGQYERCQKGPSGLEWCCLAGFEADRAVREVAERTRFRLAAAAEDERPLLDRIRIPIPIRDGHIVALDEQRTVFAHLDVGHRGLAHLL